MASLQQGQAVRIVSFKSDHSLQLEYDKLEHILLDERVKDKPVVVVSIAGAFRQGKSFLMNFFIRYMRSRERWNWLGDPREPLKGFSWKHGMDRHTIGIFVWNEVFLATTADGEEVAVLFMDTQGLFDCKSTATDHATIFALSVMTSSVQIYNIMQNIQEDHLRHLEFFTHYGHLAQKEATGKPFQRLVFLVRDSNNETYGADAGRVLLEKRLETTEDMRPEIQQLSKYIRANFSTIECFLMPYPGKEVASKNSYDGCLKDIDEDFKDHVEEFVPWILGPEHLVFKQINGKKISCQELLAYFKAYVQVFRRGELPEPRSMLQATAEASHLTAKDKASEVYMTVMWNIPHGDLTKLLGMHLNALARAKEVFDSMPKIGGYQMSKAYMDTLANELEGYYESQRITEEHRLNEELEKEKTRQRQLAELARKHTEEIKRKQEEMARKHQEEIERKEAEMARKQEENERKQAELARKHREELEIRLAEMARKHHEESERKQMEIARTQEENERKQAELARKHREELEIKLAEMARKHQEDMERKQEEITRKQEENEKKQAEIARHHREELEIKQVEMSRMRQEEFERKQAEIARKHREELEIKQAEIARTHREELERKQAEIARTHREELERKQAEMATKHQEEIERRQAELARKQEEYEKKQEETVREHREKLEIMQAEMSTTYQEEINRTKDEMKKKEQEYERKLKEAQRCQLL